MTRASVPVVTIDGPSGTGKGTIAGLLAKQLNWHLLDSGALYRAMAWAVLHADIDLENEKAVSHLLDRVELELHETLPHESPVIWCQGQNISQSIRTEECGIAASKVAVFQSVRAHLMSYQRMMHRAPGLIADGRDMGSVVFPEADLKFFLDADPELRAERRLKQLKEKGISVSLREIRGDLAERDRRDADRKLSPMKAMPDMLYIDTSDLSIEQVFTRVVEALTERLPGCL